jgi:hypothetical protein
VGDSVTQRHTTLAGAVGLFGLFAGLCAIFALVVTVFEWRVERTPTNLAFAGVAAIACVMLLALARFLAAREPPDAATRPLSPRSKIYVGAACAAMGLMVLAIGTHSALDARHATPDDFMYAPAALAFVFAGVLLALPPERAAMTRVFGALLITCFAVTFDWVAFGPGERHFAGGLSLGGAGIGARPGELLGRAMFGLGAVIFDIVAVVLWVRLLRALPS